MNNFFQEINYSSANEDGQSELTALNLKENDKVLCITGSGSRPLEILINSPEHIVAIDFNPTQNFLPELKIVAIKKLDYQNFLSFIGLKNSNDRTKIYRLLRFDLSTTTREFWDKNEQKIVDGILYCGRWEKYLSYLAKLRFLRNDIVNKIFQSATLDEQYNLWTRHWDNIFWKYYLKIVSNRNIWKFIFNEPGINNIPADFNISKYMQNRLEHAAKNIHFRNSPFAWLIFYSRYNFNEKLPLHLEEVNYHKIQNSLERIQIVTCSLNEYLIKNQSVSFDAFSISDFCSYAGEELYQNVWNNIIKRSNQGARICERQFMVKRSPAVQNESQFNRNFQLEKYLENTDNTFIYSFVTGTVV